VRRLQIVDDVAVAAADGDLYAVDLDHFGGVGADPGEGDDEGTVYPPEEALGQDVFDLAGAHL